MNNRPREIPPKGSDVHIAPEEMPLLVEKGMQGTIPAAQRDHLAHCRHCLALFVELSRGRLDHELEMLPHQAPADFVALGKALPAHESASPTTREPSHQAGRSSRRWRRWVPALAAVVACLALLGPWAHQGTGPASDDLAIIQKALDADSQHGLVHLGTNGASHTPSTVYRSLSAPDREAVLAALALLGSEYDPAAPSADIVYQRVAGHLAVAELAMARNLLDEARQLFPEDWRFNFLAAHLAYRESDLNRARSLLAGLAEQHPQQGAIQLNLGLVLRELGDPAWEDLLTEVHDRYPGSFLAERAAGNR